MVLDDKIIVLMSNGDKDNVNYKQALQALIDTDVAPQVIFGELELPIEKIPRQYKKEQ
jgi:hypothetical protein